MKDDKAFKSFKQLLCKLREHNEQNKFDNFQIKYCVHKQQHYTLLVQPCSPLLV